MLDVLLIARWPLLLICAATFGYWAVALVRIRRAVRAVPTVRAGLRLPAPDEGWPTVSVIVPAHNEEGVIDECVRSLRDQDYPDLHVVVVLDRCTDRTPEILARHAAEDARIEVIENRDCPADWTGKCNAARLGADRARGEWLLFTDADTRFEAGLVRAAIGLSLKRRLDLLSLLSTLTTHRWFERIVQPVASLNLVRMYPIERVNRDVRARPFANGQFMLFRKATYERIGGHAAVKDDLLEDIAFSRILYRASGRGGLLLADGMLLCSMYDSLDAFKSGWRRIFIEACKRKPLRLRKNALRAFGQAVVAPVQILTLAFAAWHAVNVDLGWAIAAATFVLGGWSLQGWALLRAYGMAGAPSPAVLAYPLGSWVVGGIMLNAARDLEQRRPVRWAGREYVLEAR